MLKSDDSAGRFPTEVPTMGRLAAEAALRDELEQAAILLFSADDFGRSGVNHALWAIWSFLHARGFAGQMMGPVTAVIQALSDVERGVLPELFDPDPLDADGRPRRTRSKSSAAREIAVAAAAIMECLMKRDGMSKPDAAKLVARYASDWPMVSSQIITATTVANWRDEILQAASDDPRKKAFDESIVSLTEGPDAADYVFDLLRSGPFWAGGFRPPAET